MANPLDTLLQKVRSNVGNTASRLFGQAQSFVQNNPAPSISAYNQYRNRVTEPINNNFVKPFAQAAGNSLINTVRQGVPAAVRLSPPVQLMRQATGQVTPMGQLQDAGNALSLAATAVGGSNLIRQGALGAARTILPNMAFGGGISALTGGSFAQGAGAGFAAAPQIGAVTKFTNPAIQALASKYSGKIANPLIQQLIGRGVTGAANIPEGMIINSALGRPGYSVGEAALDFGTGALFGTGASAKLNLADSVKDITFKHPNGKVEVLRGLTRDDAVRVMNELKQLGAKVTDVKSYDAPKVMGIYGGKNATGFKNEGSFSSMADKKTRFEIDDSGAKVRNLDEVIKSKTVPSGKGNIAKLRNEYQKVSATNPFDRRLGEILKEIEQIQSGAPVTTKPTVFLQDILDHPTLYENYPQLRGAVVKKQSGLASRAQFRIDETGRPELTFSTEFTRDPQTFKSELLHEIQHAIQEKEGFARGGSPTNALNGTALGKISDDEYYGALGNIQTAIDKRLNEAGLTAKIKQLLSNASDENINEFNRIFKNDPILHRLEMDRNEWGIQKRFSDNPFKAYQSLAGEVEARDVQARMNLTPEQRATTLPYQSQGIPVKDQIVRFDGGVSASDKKLSDVGKAIKWQLEKNGVKVNRDNTVTLYHATSPDRFAKIQKEGFVKGGSTATGGMTGLDLEPSAFFGTDKKWTSETWGQKGTAPVLEVKVPVEYIRQPAQNPYEVYFEGGLKRGTDGIWRPVKEPRSTFYDRLALRDYQDSNVMASVDVTKGRLSDVSGKTVSLVQEAKNAASPEEFAKRLKGKTIRVSIDELRPSMGEAASNRPGGGTTSYSKGPIEVSASPYNDSPAFVIDDGNHRYREAIARGEKTVEVKVSETADELTKYWQKIQGTHKNVGGYWQKVDVAQPPLTDVIKRAKNLSVDDYLKKRIPEIDKIDGNFIYTKDGNKIELAMSRFSDGLQINGIQAEKKGTGIGGKIVEALQEWTTSRYGSIKIDKAYNHGFWNKMGFTGFDEYSQGWSAGDKIYHPKPNVAQPPVPPSTGGEITPQEIKKVSDNLQKYNQGLGRTDAEAMARDMIINRPFNKPSSGGEIPKGGVTKGVQTPLQSRPLETTQPSTKALLNSEVPTTPKPVLQTAQIEGKGTGQNQQSLDSIISEGRKQIKTGGVKEENKTFRQVVSDLYTQWVDRYNPIVKASQQAKQVLKTKGASLRPEYDPEYLVRRLTGAGGIADQRFQTELKPIIDQVDQLKINKLDLDTYLANKRIAGFGTAGRDIYGADPKKAQEIVSALETKYGEKIKGIAEKLYAYQDKGLSEMSDFISPEAMAAMKKQNPDYSPLYRAMDDASDYLGLPTRKTMQGSQPFQKIKGSTRQIESPLESIIGNTFTQRAAIEKNRVAKAIVGLQDVADLGFKKVAKSGNDTVTVWKNGKKEFWQVGADIADVAKGVNEENMNLVLKVLQAPAALLRQGATGRNPEFMLPNIIRDQLDAGITSKYGYIPFVDFAKGVWEVAKKDINNKFNTNFDTSLYDKWANSGAKIDLGSMSGKKSIKAMFDEKTAKKGLFSWIGKGLDVLGKYSEQPTRVGLFKRAFGKTGNEMLAAMESRDATVDFARMGSKMKVANSIIPFLNVGVQGFDKLIRAVQNNPGKVAVLAGIYGAAPQIASTIYNLKNFPQEYAEIPQYEKDSNFVLVKGRNERGNVDYVTIPKGNVLPVIANPIQSFLEYVYGVDGQSFSKMAMNVLSDALPVISPGGSAKEIAIKTIGSNIPQAVKPIAETLLNKSFYKYDPNKEQSKDIVPYFLQNRPAYKQAYEFTPQMYQKIGAVVNVSPLQVQNIMEGYLAGYSKIPAQIIDMMTKVSRGEDVETNDKTILRRFIKETYPSSAKPAPKPIQSPNLMERITGKASAAGPIDKPLEDWQIQDEKYKLKQSDKKYAEVGNTIFYKKSNGDIGQADISKTPEKPTLTGQAELDKKLLSSYYSDVTSQANDIVDLYEVGKLTAQEANTKLTELKALKSSGKSKKAPKVSMARIKMPKLKRLKSYKPKKIKIKKIKLPKIKLLKAQRV